MIFRFHQNMTKNDILNLIRYAEILIGGHRCQYYITATNQMNTSIFQHYIKNFQDQEGGQILLLVDNHGSHKLNPQIHTNVRLETFRPGTTCVSQVNRVVNFLS
jgi:hypothetical protein